MPGWSSKLNINLLENVQKQNENAMLLLEKKLYGVVGRLSELGFNSERFDRIEDYTKQNIFPRIRNEEDGRTTLTVKVKLNEKTNFFKRREMETGIDAVEQVMAMMPFLGFTKKISWEKKRQSFLMRTTDNIKLFLDETPMGWFLEIEGDEKNIEAAIAKLGLQESKRINKAYLGLWEEYKKINNIAKEDMMFSE